MVNMYISSMLHIDVGDHMDKTYTKEEVKEIVLKFAEYLDFEHNIVDIREYDCWERVKPEQIEEDFDKWWKTKEGEIVK